jgi:hypothetical protein
MKKITVQLNTKSINEARKYLLNLKKQIPKMQQEFLIQVAHWVTEKANNYINLSDIGSLVKDQIKSGWEYEQTSNGVKIINRTEKAVFVEFGVGIVGQTQSHPNASAEGYEYNMESPYKSADGSWSFWLNSNERDLPMSAFEDFGTYDDHRKGGKRMVVTTRGAKGVWYAYNAIVDAQMELAKSGGGEIGKMWEDIKARYIK